WTPPAGYKALGSMKYRGPGGSFSGRAAWMAAPPDRLRVEILSPFGQPAFRMAADGERLYLDIPGEDRIRDLSAQGPALEKILGADVSVEELISILSGRPLVPEFSTARWEKPGPAFPGASRVLALAGWFGRDLLRVGLTRDDRPMRAVYYGPAGEARAEVGFTPSGAEPSLVLYGKGGGILLVEAQRLWEDTDFSEGAFTLAPVEKTP
ncbi:MAG: lipoprotein insertase outer membrane protein LolB, partial [Pseudomonadota bacterium]